MNRTLLDVLVPIILIAILATILSLLSAVVRVSHDKPSLLNRFWAVLVNARWDFRTGKYDRIGLYFIYYFLTTPLKKIKATDSKLYYSSIIARTMFVISILLIVVCTVILCI